MPCRMGNHCGDRHDCAKLAENIVSATGQDRLAFFDATTDRPSRASTWTSPIQSRWSKRTEASNDEGDYINCPMTKDEYLAFHR